MSRAKILRSDETRYMVIHIIQKSFPVIQIIYPHPRAHGILDTQLTRLSSSETLVGSQKMGEIRYGGKKVADFLFFLRIRDKQFYIGLIENGFTVKEGSMFSKKEVKYSILTEGYYESPDFRVMKDGNVIVDTGIDDGTDDDYEPEENEDYDPDYESFIPK